MIPIKKIKIGVAAETQDDAIIYVNILRNAANPSAVKVYWPKEAIFANGRISISKVAEIKNEFSKIKNLKIIIIATDRDKGEGDSKIAIESEVRRVGFKEKVLVVTPHENIEAWLLQDINSVNKVLGSNHGRVSERDLENSKELFDQWTGDVGMDGGKARKEISRIFTVQNVKSKDFTDFIQDFKRYVSEVQLEHLSRGTKKKKHQQKGKKRRRKGVLKK